MWHSSSLIAEAVHSLSDLTSDFVTLFSYRKARAPPSRNFPLGYAKLEPLGGVIVSGLLIAAGVGIALNSAELLYTLLTHPSPTSTAHPLPPIALYIMVSSVVLKEAMYRWTLHIANRVDSDVLRANAWHHRLDAASSSVALAAVAGAVYGVPWLDPVGGVLVAGMVVKAGVQSGMPSLMELLDGCKDSRHCIPQQPRGTESGTGRTW
ncbi:hypothetical protein DFJ77DRAFT_479509 [Powellomyces hirtus]|nr:hypothetical protein DFJ77DRAFT_479509 [Powellomyces hirtus]